MAEHRAVARHLGLGEEERIVGFIHIGSAKIDTPDRERPDPADLLTDWTAPAP